MKISGRAQRDCACVFVYINNKDGCARRRAGARARVCVLTVGFPSPVRRRNILLAAVRQRRFAGGRGAALMI